jgi:preprotein translocase subunit SecF
MRFPLRFIPEKTSVNFISKRWWGFSISIALSLWAIGALLSQGLNLGIDFTGGVLMEVRTTQAADLGKMRAALPGSEFGEVALQNFGDDRDVMIRVTVAEGVEAGQVVDHVKTALAERVGGELEYRKVDFVGPSVGDELVRGSIIAVVLSAIAIMLYVWFRFEWQFGVGALLALTHDAIMMMGFFAVTRYDFSLTAIAAILTVLGYSINDSVVIYDRMRENMRKYKKMPMGELINISINDTLSRTVMTSGTTMLASLSLAIFGGEVLRGFSVALVFGVVVGTYSSIFISAPALIYLKLRPEALQPAPSGA